MHLITRKEFLEKLETCLQKKIYLKIEGNMVAEFVFKKFNYQVQCDCITFEDGTNNNHIEFNLNNINSITVEDQEIICILDDQKDTRIKIEMDD